MSSRIQVQHGRALEALVAILLCMGLAVLLVRSGDGDNRKSQAICSVQQQRLQQVLDGLGQDGRRQTAGLPPPVFEQDLVAEGLLREAPTCAPRSGVRARFSSGPDGQVLCSHHGLLRPAPAAPVAETEPPLTAARVAIRTAVLGLQLVLFVALMRLVGRVRKAGERSALERQVARAAEEERLAATVDSAPIEDVHDAIDEFLATYQPRPAPRLRGLLERMKDAVLETLHQTCAPGRCPVCACRMESAVATCAACDTPHHAECMDYNGGCGIYACTGLPRRRGPRDD